MLDWFIVHRENALCSHAHGAAGIAVITSYGGAGPAAELRGSMNEMNECPDMLDGARVLCWTPLDDRHRPTGQTRHYADGQLQTGFTGLAIATYDKDESCYLFYCNAQWEVENDTLHRSLAEAKADAERQFNRTSETWIQKGTPNNEMHPTN